MRRCVGGIRRAVIAAVVIGLCAGAVGCSSRDGSQGGDVAAFAPRGSQAQVLGRLATATILVHGTSMPSTRGWSASRPKFLSRDEVERLLARPMPAPVGQFATMPLYKVIEVVADRPLVWMRRECRDQESRQKAETIRLEFEQLTYGESREALGESVQRADRSLGAELGDFVDSIQALASSIEHVTRRLPTKQMICLVFYDDAIAVTEIALDRYPDDDEGFWRRRDSGSHQADH